MAVKTIDIAGRLVGSHHPCFIIAEAGVNHDGDPEMAKRLVIEAKKCGADCVKFQTFKAEQIVTAASPKADYQLKTTDPKETQLQMLQGLELSATAHEEVFELARKEGIICFSTPYSVEDIELLRRFRVAALKIASGQITEPNFLQHAARTGLPIILSTGMATMAEVATAVETIQDAGNERLVLLQCTTNYPSRIQDANLRVMGTFRQAFGWPVGYSDHTEGTAACLAAVALGASVLEKHFTLDRSLPGPDHAGSSDPTEFEALVRTVRQVEAALGSPIKRPTEAENRNAKGMRRSIVAYRDIAQGSILREADLAFKRPGDGIAPALAAHISGRRARIDIAADKQITWTDLE